MTTVQVILNVPSELIERAKAAGLELQMDNDQWIEFIEDRIRRREAGRELKQIAREIQSLPASLRPSPDDIEAEIQMYRAEKAQKSG